MAQESSPKTGFSILELVVIAAIFVMVFATIIGSRDNVPEREQTSESDSIQVAARDITVIINLVTTLDNSVELPHSADTGKKPDEDAVTQGIAGLTALLLEETSNMAVALPLGECPTSGPVLIDPWGNPYIYVNPGRSNAEGFDLYSAGPNGIDEDGAGDDVTASPECSPLKMNNKKE